MAYIGRRLIIILLSQADVSSRQKNSLPRPTETGWPMKNSGRPQTDMGLTLVKMSRRQNFFGRSLMNEQSPTACTPKHLCNSPFSCPKTRHKLNEMNSPQIHFSVKPYFQAKKNPYSTTLQPAGGGRETQFQWKLTTWTLGPLRKRMAMYSRLKSPICAVAWTS